MLTELAAARLPFVYLVMDTHDTAGWCTRLAGRLHSTWVGTLHPRTTVVWHGRRQQVAELAGGLRLGWRPRLGLRAAAVTVYAPTYGMLRLVVTRNRHGNHDDLVTGDLAADLATVVVRKQRRWRVETIFRDTKQSAGLGACQCWTDQAMVRHIALVLLALWSCNGSASTPPSPLPRSRSAGSWPSPANRSNHQPPSRPARLTSASPRKSCN
jgi:hypothetical protein